MSMARELWMIIPVGASAGANVCDDCTIFGERRFTYPMVDVIEHKAESLSRQPLPENFDNTPSTQYGFENNKRIQSIHDADEKK